MSESVKIGGIRKNPAIDRINSMNFTEVKKSAKKKMEQLLLAEEAVQIETFTRLVPIDFSKARWKGTAK